MAVLTPLKAIDNAVQNMTINDCIFGQRWRSMLITALTSPSGAPADYSYSEQRQLDEQNHMRNILLALNQNSQSLSR